MDAKIDVTRDLYADTPDYYDPDANSPILHLWHSILWSKETAKGRDIRAERAPRRQIMFRSGGQDVRTSSDLIANTYAAWTKPLPGLAEASGATVMAASLACRTIGAFLVFPSERIDGKPTINGARGMAPRVRDRFDVTLECVRRHYSGEESPLTEPLARYDEFFRLFDDFPGYVEFFHLQDLVDADGAIHLFHPASNFDGDPLPSTPDGRTEFLGNLCSFVEARNARIEKWQSDKRS